MHTLYITTYNHPAMLERLQGQLTPCLLPDMHVVLADQSTPEFAAIYQRLAQQWNWGYVHSENQGASAAKRRIIELASASADEFYSQVSEDFQLSADTAQVYWLPSGSKTFLQDTVNILRKRPHLAYCNWTFARETNSDLWNFQLSREARLTLHKVTDLCHVEGELVVFGWPYTARVDRMRCIYQAMMASPKVKHFTGPDGGEWVLASFSLGQGATLLAQPVWHDRPPELRPENRKP